ncbi:MAG: hypothetical protein CFE24_02160 [Flavobacterium sp. BFFFF2]|nr:MAG: hypothetical protein CFE24_02160 [Flavobacterium sp. BFFFF2]
MRNLGLNFPQKGWPDRQPFFMLSWQWIQPASSKFKPRMSRFFEYTACFVIFIIDFIKLFLDASKPQFLLKIRAIPNEFTTVLMRQFF